MTPIMKLLLNYIKDNIDENDQIKMSNSELSLKLGVHVMSISRCVKLLKQENIIETKYEDNLRRVITLL